MSITSERVATVHIRRAVDLTATGLGPAQVAELLVAEGVPVPREDTNPWLLSHPDGTCSTPRAPRPVDGGEGDGAAGHAGGRPRRRVRDSAVTARVELHHAADGHLTDDGGAGSEGDRTAAVDLVADPVTPVMAGRSLTMLFGRPDGSVPPPADHGHGPPPASPEQHPRACDDLHPHRGREIVQVPRQLVEHQRQRERIVLVRQARVAGQDRAVAQLGRGLLDHLPVGPVDVDPAAVVLALNALLPVVALLVGARGKRASPACAPWPRPARSQC